MNKLICIITALAFAAPLHAQCQMQSVSVSSGESAISSGITGTARFACDSRYFEFVAQAEQAWFMYGYRFTGAGFKVMATGTIGHFQGAPWVGPFLSVTSPAVNIIGVPVSISTIQWPAFFLLWAPRDWKDKYNPEDIHVGYFANLQLNAGPVVLSYARLNFLNEPWNELPGASFTTRINNNFVASSSATWNNNAGKWMFMMSVTWTPQSVRR